MGQSVSRRTPDVQPTSSDAGDNQRRRRWSTAFRPSSLRFDSSSSQYSSQTSSPTMARTPTTNHHSSSSPARRPTRLCRARTSISDSLPRLLARTRRPQMRSTHSLTMPTDFTHSGEAQGRSTQAIVDRYESSLSRDSRPRYESMLPSDQAILGGIEDDLMSDPTSVDNPPNEPTITRSSSPLARFRDMIPRHTLRRRRSPRRHEDQTTMLTDLLSAAAAATADSILGSEAGSASSRNLAGDENGAFGDFLAQLREGNIAGALRSGNNNTTNGTIQNTLSPDLNFFRMFRFGATDAASSPAATNEQEPANDTESTYTSDNTAGGESLPDGRMVPIIIVGIRSINPGSQGNDNLMPPFFDSLSGLTPEAPSNTTIDALMRPPRNNASFSHRRRTSDTLRRLGSLQQAASAMSESSRPDASELRRRHSTTSDSISGPRPPPSTPASTGLSTFSSGATTPTTNAATPVGPLSAATSRRGSVSRRPNASGDTLTDPLLRQPRLPRTRRFSEDFDVPRYGPGSARRNGVVGLDNSTDNNSESEPHRSWIIYVLGGSYPENHPLLSTPSLFTDNPQYEDMLLLASLLGPAKPPVATEEEIARASGLYKIGRVYGINSHLQAVEVFDQAEGVMPTEPDVIRISDDERCLVCLCNYEIDEQARRLQCRHLYHQECIDQWLLTGRNSCPLCRTEGVQKSPDESGENAAETSETTAVPNDVALAPAEEAV